MKRMSAAELSELESAGATVRPLARKPEPLPPPTPPPAPDPVAGLAAMFGSIAQGLEAASQAKQSVERISQLEEEIAELRSAPSPPVERGPEPDYGRIVDAAVDAAVEAAIARIPSPELPPPRPKIGKVDILRRGKLIEKVKAGGRTVVFHRRPDGLLSHLEFSES